MLRGFGIPQKYIDSIQMYKTIFKEKYQHIFFFYYKEILTQKLLRLDSCR